MSRISQKSIRAPAQSLTDFTATSTNLVNTPRSKLALKRQVCLLILGYCG